MTNRLQHCNDVELLTYKMIEGGATYTETGKAHKITAQAAKSRWLTVKAAHNYPELPRHVGRAAELVKLYGYKVEKI